MRFHFPVRLSSRVIFCAGILAALAGCMNKPAVESRTGTSPSPASKTAHTEPVVARDILLRMARFLAATPRFSVNVTGNYDAVQATGQQIEFGEKLSINVSRPKGLRVEAVASDGNRQLLFFDGQTLTTYSPASNVYAQAAKPGDIDTAVTYFLNDLQMRLPLAALLLSRFPDEIGKRSQTVDYVEKTAFYGAPAHHLAGRTEALDYEIWVAEGAQPLPQRIVLTYRDAEGQPAFRAQFSGWNLAPQERVNYTFTPPADARQIALAAQLPQQTALTLHKTAKSKGGQP
jgi:hypothetical protein